MRPLSRTETERGYFNIVSVLDDKMVILYDPQEVINSGGSPYEFQSTAVLQRGKER